MSKNIVISKASVEAAGKIAEIEKENFSMPWSEKSITESMEQDNYIFLKAECEGDIAGYIGFYYSFDTGDITNIAVMPDYRRQGVGSRLLLALIDECKKKDIVSIMLEVRESNLNAISLYKKIGFNQVGIRKNFYQKPTENAILMDYICN